MVLEDGRVVEDVAFSKDEVRFVNKSLSSQEGRREQLLEQPNSRPFDFIVGPVHSRHKDSARREQVPSHCRAFHGG